MENKIKARWNKYQEKLSKKWKKYEKKHDFIYMIDSQIFNFLSKTLAKCVSIVNDKEIEELDKGKGFFASTILEEDPDYVYYIKFNRKKIDRCDNECQKS